MVIYSSFLDSKLVLDVFCKRINSTICLIRSFLLFMILESHNRKLWILSRRFYERIDHLLVSFCSRSFCFLHLSGSLIISHSSSCLHIIIYDLNLCCWYFNCSSSLCSFQAGAVLLNKPHTSIFFLSLLTFNKPGYHFLEFNHCP